MVGNSQSLLRTCWGNLMGSLHSLVAGLLARGQCVHPEGPATSCLDTGPFGFPLSLRKP
jgi:hypothetical protein